MTVYKLDRFSRNKFEMAMHRKHLKDNGIKILSAMENIADSPEGILLESLLEGMNHYYSEECFYGHNISNQYHALNAWYAQALQGHITGLRLKTH